MTMWAAYVLLIEAFDAAHRAGDHATCCRILDSLEDENEEE